MSRYCSGLNARLERSANEAHLPLGEPNRLFSVGRALLARRPTAPFDVAFNEVLEFPQLSVVEELQRTVVNGQAARSGGEPRATLPRFLSSEVLSCRTNIVREFQAHLRSRVQIPRGRSRIFASELLIVI